MVVITVLKTFYDLKQHKNRMAGDTFEETEERAAHIDAVLPGYISYEKSDIHKMTMPQLMELAKERGIKPKGRPSKSQLIALLTEE